MMRQDDALQLYGLAVAFTLGIKRPCILVKWSIRAPHCISVLVHAVWLIPPKGDLTFVSVLLGCIRDGTSRG